MTFLSLFAASAISAAKPGADLESVPAAAQQPAGRWNGFGSALIVLWLRAMTLGIIAFVFAEALTLTGKAQAWSFYLTSREVAFELAVRLIGSALAGLALGTLYAVIIGPVLWYFNLSRERFVDWATKAAVILVVFLDSRLALKVLITSSYQWYSHRRIFDTIALSAHALAFAIVLCIPRGRKSVVTSLDGCLGKKMTRRTAIATVVGAAVLATTEFALAKARAGAKFAFVGQRPKSNFLLITFDALDAEDMSLYGRGLPTTPNIDRFAQRATVFTNFYSSATFTTPSLATLLTGVYPSQSHVYHLGGRVRSADSTRSLPHLMRVAGYATAAFASNPLAYYLGESLQNEFDFLPQPTFQAGAFAHFWNATRFLHQNSGIGSRLDEYMDLESVWDAVAQIPSDLPFRLRPDAVFAQASKLMSNLPEGFFLWVHVITPHNPYFPDPADRGRFLSTNKNRRFEEEFENRFIPHYQPEQQALMDELRLRYDEFLATADRAFGKFMSDLEGSGKLRNTTVIVSADHGESFQGGIYRHRSPYQTRPVIHIPLIIRRPGQQTSHSVAFTADQTALAPTILELAGQPRPDWMAGQSLVNWLDRDGQGEGEGLAFTQHLEKNTAFRPIRRGTLGAIDGKYQYVIDLETKKGALRPLNQADVWNLDRSAENPTRAEALRAAIYARFPELAR